MDDTLRSCRDFSELLAAAVPAPGGGGAAALTAALGIALGHMVGAFTVGKKRYAATEEEMKTLMSECDELRLRLLDLVEADAAGFEPLAKAYSIPKDAPDRTARMETALLKALEAPLSILELSCRCIEVTERIFEIGSVIMKSDAGCAAAILQGALESASLNIYVNTKSLSDRATAGQLNERCQRLTADYSSRARRIYLASRELLLPTEEHE